MSKGQSVLSIIKTTQKKEWERGRANQLEERRSCSCFCICVDPIKEESKVDNAQSPRTDGERLLNARISPTSG
jgi:hypothetical protein